MKSFSTSLKCCLGLNVIRCKTLKDNDGTTNTKMSFAALAAETAELNN